MKIHISYPYFIIPTIILLFLSCDKHHAKRLSGTYSCEVHHRGWGINGDVDTIKYRDIIIEQNKRFVEVEDIPIHIDSLWKEKKYHYVNKHGTTEVLFKNDSIYLYTYRSGLGEVNILTYKGVKK